MEASPLEQYVLGTQRPAVVVIAGTPAVVLDYAADDTVWVWRSGIAVIYPAALPVMPVTDEQQARTAVQQALVGLESKRLVATQQLDDAINEHRDTLRRIRLYVITKYRQGMFDREHLDIFLKHFGFAPYHQAETRVDFTITGEYQVATADAREPLVDAVLSVDTSRIGDLKDNSTTVQVHVYGGHPSPANSQTTTVTYRIIGSFVVLDDDLNRIEADARNCLRPDLSAVPAYLPASATHWLSLQTTLVE